jgi:hypothetical protein
MYRAYTKTWISGVVTMDTGQTLATFTPVKPVRITRFGAIVDTATTANPNILTLDHHLVGGANLDPDQDDTAAGNLSVPISAAGLGYYKDAVDFDDGKPILILPGEQVDVVGSGGATVGDAHVFIEYEEEPFVDAKIQRGASAREVVDDDGYLDLMTKVTS